MRENARTQTLDARSYECTEAVARWDEFGDFLALRLYRDLGSAASLARPNNMTTEQRRAAVANDLAKSGQLAMTLRIPGTLGDIDVIANLRTRQVLTAVDVPAPEERVRAKARIMWLLRQLDDVPEPLTSIEAVYKRGVRATAGLADARDEPERLLHPTDPKQLPRVFRVSTYRDMGQKRGTGKGSFMAETTRQVIDFYRDVVQVITPLPKRPPQLAGTLAEKQEAASKATPSQPEPGQRSDPFDAFVSSP